MGAAVVVPLVISGIATLAPYIKPFILTVENLFGKGTGTQKLATVTGMVQVLGNDLAKAGTISGLPTVEQITALVQGTVDDMKSKGLLTGPAPISVSTGTAGAPVATTGAALTLNQEVAALLSIASKVLANQ